MLNVLTHSFPTRRSSGREGVGEEAGQAVEAVAGEVGEQEHRFRRIGWHGQWREFDAAAAPGRVVLEGVAAGPRVGPDGANALVPEADFEDGGVHGRSEEHTSALQSLMRNSYAVFCLKQKTRTSTP